MDAEAKKAKRREWYLKNRERILAKNKAYWEARKEILLFRQREKYAANKDSLKDRKRAYYEANKEHIAERRRQRYQENKEHVLARNNAYKAALPKGIDSALDIRASVRREAEARKARIAAMRAEYARKLGVSA